MKPIRVTRNVQIPDPVRIDRYRRAPDLGPKILFFSGGTAWNPASRALKGYTHNSVHLVTPFDSGGSSAALRNAFAMPAIGDMRNRLMALVDESVTGNPAVSKLFFYRFPAAAAQRELVVDLERMLRGAHPMVAAVSEPLQELIRDQLACFRQRMPGDFDLRGASIGNLVLAGGYLKNHRHLDPIVFLFSKLAGVLGTVRTVVNDDLQLSAELDDGRRIVGQHRLTGKEVAPLDSPIRRLFLCRGPDCSQQITCAIGGKNRRLIAGADLICFPPGSFYTSLVANLLPAGVGRAVAQNPCPKLYIPNLGSDPEQLGMTLEQAVTHLLDRLRADVGGEVRDDRLLDFVLMDSRNGRYPSALSHGRMAELGLRIIDVPLVTEQSAPYYDPERLVAAILSLT